VNRSAQIQQRRRGRIDRQDCASHSVSTRKIWMNQIDIQTVRRVWLLSCCEAGEEGRFGASASSLSSLVL